MKNSIPSSRSSIKILNRCKCWVVVFSFSWCFLSNLKLNPKIRKVVIAWKVNLESYTRLGLISVCSTLPPWICHSEYCSLMVAYFRFYFIFYPPLLWFGHFVLDFSHVLCSIEILLSPGWGSQRDCLWDWRVQKLLRMFLIPVIISYQSQWKDFHESGATEN